MKEDRLIQLIKKHEQLGAQIEDLKAKTAIQLRKDDTRRKILLGACLLAKNGGDFNVWLDDLDKFLTTKTDRTLFNLPIKQVNHE